MTRFSIALSFLLLMGACNSSKNTKETSDQAPQERQQSRKQGGPPDAAQAIAQMDANADGKLSINEVKGRLKDDFPKIDSNGDGFLTKAELESAKPARGSRPQRN